jgi:hypothetical protein
MNSMWDAGTQGRRDAGTQGRRDAGTQGRFALLAAFCGIFGTAFGEEIPVEWTDPAQNGVQSAVGKANNGDTLLFPESTFVFDDEVLPSILRDVFCAGTSPFSRSAIGL